MGRFIFLSLGLLVVALFLSGAGADHHCPPDWSSFNEFCYKVFRQWRTWNDAEMSCRQQQNGSHLASIHSAPELTHVASVISNDVLLSGIWIGLSDPQKNLTWEWSDGSRLDYTLWKKGEPKNLGYKKYCVKLYRWSEYLQWKAAKCKYKHFFICKL